MKFKSLRFTRQGAVGVLLLNRPAKRNALSDAMVAELDACIAAVPSGVLALVLHGAGEHFRAGLDLAELSERSAAQGMAHSRGWHGVFHRIQFGRVPVVAVLHGAVVGGGLELASCAHVRIADMMFTDRVLSAEEGQAAGISTYLVGLGKGLAKGIELARKIASNAPATNFALMHALPRIAELGQDAGLLMESLMAGIAQSEPEAKQRMKDFLEKRGAKVRRER